MRNDQRTLTPAERAVVLRNAEALAVAMREGAVVAFRYTKDTGESSDREGTVVEFMGAESKASVRVEDVDGIVKTFNLRNITLQTWHTPRL